MPKFFCIGHFKTGTASYSQAMAMLGLRDLHFPRRYIEAMHDAGRPILWERVQWDSMSNVHELPGEWNALLDLYPDARFILTTRDVDKWLASIKAHMERRWPPDLQALFDARFERVFGLPCRAEAFDAGALKRQFIDQDVMAMDMLASRMLVLNLDGGDDLMVELVRFTGRAVRYPHANKRSRRKPGEPLVVGGRREYMEVA